MNQTSGSGEAPEAIQAEHPVEASLEVRKQELKKEFLIKFEEALFDEHLTVEQLGMLSAEAANFMNLDNEPIDNGYLTLFGGPGLGENRGLRGEGIKSGRHIMDSTLKDLAEEVFAPIHEKTLVSKLRRHDDGLRVDSIGIIGGEIRAVIDKVLLRTKEFRMTDTEQDYDKGVLRSYISRISHESHLSVLPELFKQNPELRNITIGELANKISFGQEGMQKIFSAAKIDDNDAHWAIHFLKDLPGELGPDNREVPVSVLDDLIRAEFSKREETRKDASAKKGDNYEI